MYGLEVASREMIDVDRQEYNGTSLPGPGIRPASSHSLPSKPPTGKVMTQATTIFQGPLGQDILPIIFAYLPCGFPRRNRDLLNASRVCKMCLGPVMDIIWRSLYCPGPVLRLLPLSEQHYNGTREFEEVELSPQCRERLGFYCRRVRSITFGEWNLKGKFSLELYQWLYDKMNGDHLFPALRQLSFDTGHGTHTILPLFLSPALQDVIIRGRPTSLNTLLMSPKLAPYLTKLDLDGYLKPLVSNPPTHPSDALELIRGFKYLRNLRITCAHGKHAPVDSRSLHALLAALPLLEQLDLRWIYFVNTKAVPRDDWVEVCDNLSQFTLLYTPPSPTPTRREFFAPCPILGFVTDLEISLPTTFLRQSAETFFLSIAASLKLQEVNIVAPFELEISLQIMLPLLSIQSLRTFKFIEGTLVHRIESGSSDSPRTSFSDLATSAVSQRSQLNRLEFMTRINPPPTLDDLQVFSKNLPRLEHLVLPLNLSSIPTAPDFKADEPRFSNALKYLQVYDADEWEAQYDEEEEFVCPFHPSEYLPLAQRLNAWFPNLGYASSIVNTSHWELINDIRKVLQENTKLKRVS
ncbi:hypothetical protein BKA70DRAFT_1466056 [Coprinopsis sp. MPI-PUGE-AT-0042]|nr:hypothetical protein BKA70DRAFT_1466056 [Coprinopsis sp. MPI-PUGE-AT-0042]